MPYLDRLQHTRDIGIMEIYRIGLIGSAGLGKSGIATELAKKLGIAFLRSKDTTRPILKELGYDYDKCECVEKFLSDKDIEYSIVEKKTRQEQLLRDSGFITDRTTLECFAYALLSVDKYEQDEIALLEKVCKENMSQYTHLFYFPYKGGWLEANGIRTVNTYFQWKIDMLIRGLIEDWGINVITIPQDGDKADFIGERLGAGNNTNI